MTIDDLSLTLGREGVTTSPPSTLAPLRLDGGRLARRRQRRCRLRRRGSLAGGPGTAPDPADLGRAEPLGQFAAGAAVALADRPGDHRNRRRRSVFHRRLDRIGVRAGRRRMNSAPGRPTPTRRWT